MSTAAARRFTRTVKVIVALLVILASGLGPMGVAKAADIVFPIVFIPVYSQDENIAGVFTDTRIIIFNPSRHCPIAQDPGCTAGLLAGLGPGTEVEMFWFDEDQNLVAINSRPLTPFDVEVITGPFIPSGTGTAIFVNVFSVIASPVILAFFHPLAVVVEIGAKLAQGPIPDPAGNLFALTAVNGQVIPALAGEFARVEVTAGVNGAGILFGPGWETVIAETCLLPFTTLQNFVVDDAERFLFDVLIPCTGFFIRFQPPGIFGPDLALWTPDDGGLLGTPVTAPGLGLLKDGYNRLAIDVNATGILGGFGIFYGQAFVIAPGGVNRQAYSYEMPANFFLPFTANQRPAALSPNAVVTAGITTALDQITKIGASAVASLFGSTADAIGIETDCTTVPIPDCCFVDPEAEKPVNKGYCTIGDFFHNDK
jgi:hypothetical protein